MAQATGRALSYWPRSELTRTLLTRLALDWVTALRFLAQGQTADARAILRAHRDFARQRAYWQQKRRQFPPRLTVAQRPGVFDGSLVWAYFVQGKRRFSELDSTLLP